MRLFVPSPLGPWGWANERGVAPNPESEACSKALARSLPPQTCLSIFVLGFDLINIFPLDVLIHVFLMLYERGMRVSWSDSSR